MSHTTRIKAMQITSAAAVRQAVARLAAQGIKIELLESATPRAFYANQEGMGQADLVIKLGDAPYDIGLYRQADGTYEPRTDFWGQHVEKVLGAPATAPEHAMQAKLGKFYQAYGIEAALEQAYLSGKMVTEVTQPNGDIQLVVTGYA